MVPEFILLFIIIATYITNSESCVRLYPDHIIDYISNNIATDSSIQNLGIKTSSIQCENSCIHFNYLCNASTDVIYYGAVTGEWQLNEATCEITALDVDWSWTRYITHDLISTEYVIEMELTLTDRREAGVYWKGAYDASGSWLRGFYLGLDAVDRAPVVAYEEDLDYVILKKETLASNPGYDTRHNLSIYHNYDTFTAYFNGEQYYNGTVDTSTFTDNYIGVYNYYADVIFHSLFIRFPNTKDEMFCSAFVFNKDDGSCYGYYGDDYIAIETSLATQSAYDAGIRYDSITCPEETTTSEPTASPLATSAPSEPITSKPTRSTLLTLEPTASSLSTSAPSESIISEPTSSPLSTLTLESTDFVSSRRTSSPLATSSASSAPQPPSLTMSTLTEIASATDEDKINSKPKASPSGEIYIVITLGLMIIAVVFITGYIYYKYKQLAKPQKDLNRNAKQEESVNDANLSQLGVNSMQLEQAQSDSDHEQKPPLQITSGATNNVINADAVMKGSALMTRGGAIKEKVVNVNDEVNSDENATNIVTNTGAVINADAVLKGSILMTKGEKAKNVVNILNEHAEGENSDEDDDDLWMNSNKNTSNDITAGSNDTNDNE